MSSKRIRLKLPLPVVLVALSALAAEAGAAIVAPNVPVAGTSQAVWGDKWWQWVISYPPATNPQNDTTGAFSSVGDQGQVFFLAGTLGTTATRSATVKQGQTVLIPFGTSISMIPLFGNTEAEIRADAAATNGTPSNFFLTVDGAVPAPPAGFSALTSFHQATPPGTFTWVVPQNNIYSPGLPGGTYQSVEDGWWVMFSDLTVGKHTIHWGGHTSGTPPLYGPVDFDLTYNLTVVPVPEPGSLCLLPLAAGMLLIRRRRQLA